MKNNLDTIILKWYKKNARQLPWREKTNYFKTWLSEVMLQQTQVNTVIPYYKKWIKKYSSFRDIAKTPIDILLKDWEGLGYYNRIRNFHKSATIISNNNQHPIKYNDLIKMPGVGPYMAGAILSIALNQPYPAIDSNINRIISRILCINKTDKKFSKKIYNYIQKIISIKKPGFFNQALMDIGSIICKPKNPKCEICPLKNNCKAYKKGIVNLYPMKNLKNKKPLIKVCVAILNNKNKFLLTKRLDNAFLGGLWELPGGKIKKGENKKKCIQRELKEELGINNIKIENQLNETRHTYSNFNVLLYPFVTSVWTGKPKNLASSDLKWVTKKSMEKFPIPSATKTILNQFFKEYNV